MHWHGCVCWRRKRNAFALYGYGQWLPMLPCSSPACRCMLEGLSEPHPFKHAVPLRCLCSAGAPR